MKGKKVRKERAKKWRKEVEDERERSVLERKAL